MNKRYLMCLLAGILGLLSASDTGKFPVSKEAFVEELGDFMKQDKNKASQASFARFQAAYEGGVFPDSDIQHIRELCDEMKLMRLEATPHFSNYIDALLALYDKRPQASSGWHQSLLKLIQSNARKKLKVFQSYLHFSNGFFQNDVLASNTAGLVWKVEEAEYQIKDGGETAHIVFDRLNLVGMLKTDTLRIIQTSGTFDVATKQWEGAEGRIDWPLDQIKEVYSTLDKYKIDLRKSHFATQNASLTYPEYLGGRSLDGALHVRIKRGVKKSKASYPRFESAEGQIITSDMGEGLQYEGGFKLWGSKVYGFGKGDQRAIIRQENPAGGLAFVAKAKHFIISPGEKISGEQVEVVIYPFGQDSICHPSVNIKYNIPEKELHLARGKRGSDRNPFYDSYHQLNIETEKISWEIPQNNLLINPKKKEIGNGQPKVNLTSTEYFDIQQFRRLQNVADYHPVASLKGLSDKLKTKTIDALTFARLLNPRFDISSIQSLLYELVAGGFINYDKDAEKLHLLPKVFHSADANMNKIDYDNIRIVSVSDQTNAEVRGGNNDLIANDVKVLEFSDRQKVALKPYKNQITLKKNRDMQFDGRLFAGFALFEGKDFNFHYDPFNIVMDSIRYLDLFIPTGEKDKRGQDVALSIGSRIEDLSGTLLIDAPGNKSGKEDIEMFPAFISKQPSFVYYDAPQIQNSCYQRDSFYFELEPFNFEQLDQLQAADIRFKGRLQSGGIFPEIEETLALQIEDQSFGFETVSPTEGFDLYGGKGRFDGMVRLGNQGLKGEGGVRYLWADIQSENFVFKPDQMLTGAQEFALSESREGAIEVPQVKGQAVAIDWKPYKDSMYIRSEDAPFELFTRPGYSVDQLLILTPGGLKAKGTFNWAHGLVEGQLMSIGAFSISSDTCDLKVKVKGLDHLALNTKDVYTRLDFENFIGTVAANADTTQTTLPYNKFKTNLNEYDWDMKNETITFRSRDQQMGLFQSLLKQQEGLAFEGRTAFYKLKTSELKLGGVEHIRVADALIYPDSGYVDVLPGGIIPPLENAVILADTIHKYHRITAATVRVKGRYEFEAKGLYEYNIGEHQQSIRLDNILGTYHGKGRRSKQSLHTWAKGIVNKEDQFFIDHKTGFYGEIELQSKNRHLSFDGYAQLQLESLQNPQWFCVGFQGDRKNFAMTCPEPRNEEDQLLFSGLFLKGDFSGLSAGILQPMRQASDRVLFNAAGLIKYLPKKDQLLVGDSLKLVGLSQEGNAIRLDNKEASLTLDGTFELASNMPFVKMKTAGRTTFKLNEPDKIKLRCASGWDFFLPEKLLKVVNSDIQSSLFEARLLDYSRDTEYYENALTPFLTDLETRQKTLHSMPHMGLEMPSKQNDYTFLFSDLELQWNNTYQSFLSSRKQVGLASIKGKKVNRWLDAFVEVKMPTGSTDRFYLYLKSPSDYYYFFSYKDGVLSTVSNNETYNATVEKLGKKERLRKMKGGEYYEVQLADPSSAKAFINRVKAGR